MEHLKEWCLILDTLEWYGQERISSDESKVGDNIEEIDHPRLLPWCQWEADAYMDILDRTRKLPGQGSHLKKGRPLTKWIYCGEKTVVSIQDPVMGLPAVLYHQQWMDGLTTTKRWKLHASLSPFKWKQIKYQNESDESPTKDEQEVKDVMEGPE